MNEMPGHPHCYAQALCDCEGKPSGEHYVSDKVLRAVSQAEKSVRVSGLKFLPFGAESQIGISSLVGNTLCKKHNSDLSVFDTAGLNFFNAMEHAMVPDSRVVPLQVSGDQVERWMLKSLIGGLYSGQFPTPEGMALKDVCPPDQWLGILFRNQPFPARFGLYLYHGNDGEQFLLDHHVLRFAVVPGHSPGGGNAVICGMSMWVFGIEFYLGLANLPDALPVENRLNRATHRPTHIICSSGKTLILDWEGSNEVRGVVLNLGDVTPTLPPDIPQQGKRL
jgi:hypothetical protein